MMLEFQTKPDYGSAKRYVRVYIAHPLNGLTGSDEEKRANIAENEKICRMVLDECKWAVPLSPLCAFGFHPGSDQEDAMKCCYKLLDKCAEVWVFGDWERSSGTTREIIYALSSHMTVRFFTFSNGHASEYKSEESLPAFCRYLADRLRDLLGARSPVTEGGAPA